MLFIDQKGSVWSDKINIGAYLTYPWFKGFACKDIFATDKNNTCIVAVRFQHDDLSKQYLSGDTIVFDV